jgi:hypothetical protein
MSQIEAYITGLAIVFVVVLVSVIVIEFVGWQRWRHHHKW